MQLSFAGVANKERYGHVGIFSQNKIYIIIMGAFHCPLELMLTWAVKYSEWSHPESALSAFADILFQPSINHSSKTYVPSQVNTLLKKTPNKSHWHIYFSLLFNKITMNTHKKKSRN